MPATSDQIDALAKNKANEVLKLASDQMKAGTFQVDSFEDGVNKMIDSWKGEIDLILSNAVWGKDSCHPRHDGWHILAYSKYDSDISVVVVENKIVGFSPKCSRFSRVVTCMWGKVLLSDAIKVFVYNSASQFVKFRFSASLGASPLASADEFSSNFQGFLYSTKTSRSRRSGFEPIFFRKFFFSEKFLCKAAICA